LATKKRPKFKLRKHLIHLTHPLKVVTLISLLELKKMNMIALWEVIQILKDIPIGFTLKFKIAVKSDPLKLTSAIWPKQEISIPRVWNHTAKLENKVLGPNNTAIKQFLFKDTAGMDLIKKLINYNSVIISNNLTKPSILLIPSHIPTQISKPLLNKSKYRIHQLSAEKSSASP
jgi:hypothetical protein